MLLIPPMIRHDVASEPHALQSPFVSGELSQPGAPDRPCVPAAGDSVTLASVKRASRWLSRHASNVNSQAGEDGILAKALSMLPDPTFWCIEFGAWDGLYFSNTYNLVARPVEPPEDQTAQGCYRTVLIESDPEKYRQLCSSYPFKDRAIFINAYVGWSQENGLDRILSSHPIPKNPDLLSIDVDGNDYHIWRATKDTKPKLVLIEYNPTMANCVEFVQPASASCNQGNSPASLVKLGKEKGYELIAVTRLNLLFVDRQYYSLFNIPDNSLDAMRDDPQDLVFCGYDGTIFIKGAIGARWHRRWLSPEDIQVLPGMLRSYPPAYTPLQRIAAAIHRAVCQPRKAIQRLLHPIAESNHEAEQRRRENLPPMAGE